MEITLQINTSDLASMINYGELTRWIERSGGVTISHIEMGRFSDELDVTFEGDEDSMTQFLADFGFSQDDIEAMGLVTEEI